MKNKLQIGLITAFLLTALLAGCSFDGNGSPQSTTPAQTPDNSSESEQLGTPGNTPESAVEAQPSQSSINLPVVGVSEATATADADTEIGAGQNPPEEAPQNPESGGGVLVESQVVIDSVTVQVEEGELPEVRLVVQGSLPTPCHQFAFQPEQPDVEGRLNVRLFSLYDPQLECAQMLQPFEQQISLGLFPPGSYTILINGEVLQELDL